jgi:hypothetical protein
MVTKRADTEKVTPFEEDLTETRMQLKRNARCPCSGCRVKALFMDFDAYRKKIETNLEMKRS